MRNLVVQLLKVASQLLAEEDKKEYILADFMSEGLSAEKGITKDDVDADELAKGIKVEMEHTSNKMIATKIAMDHLSEDGQKNYYTKLAKMESV